MKNKITKIDNLTIIEDNNKKYCIKKNRNKNIINILEYLKSKDFNNIIPTKIINGFEIRDYIPNIKIDNEDKLNELVYLLTILHTKTTHYKNISLDEIKKIYEEKTDSIIDTKNYYDKLLEENDEYLFLAPSIYLLERNISLILKSCDTSKMFLDKWYDIIKNKKTKRVVYNHNNLKLSNLIINKYPYLINWDNLIIDYPTYDLESLFKNNYKYMDMIDLFIIYNSKYQLLEEELYFLFASLLEIEKIYFTNDEPLNTELLYEKIKYLQKINEFLNEYMKRKKNKC